MEESTAQGRQTINQKDQDQELPLVRTSYGVDRTVHLPTDCRLNGAAKSNDPAAPTNTNPTPTGVTAAAATFTAKSIMNLIGSTMGLVDKSDY